MRPKFPSTDGVACHDRHDGCGTHRYFLAASEQGVHEAAHEGGVESVLRWKLGYDGVRDTLGDDCQPGGEASDHVRDGVLQAV